ncbi:S1C family serine protease [Lysinibacter cavernae]|uniref:Putative serine protease PepD n=1 Tax=Lysinibacter cavernae TaxID=1640652 RepID=A0A7X5QYD1_9MICO|nr:trypsin-like peptidase domain-containing protein [Lysinibacter cavernae]NIH52246.1 putative serine protease PepD [Lysinibacter cavernae]
MTNPEIPNNAEPQPSNSNAPQDPEVGQQGQPQGTPAPAEQGHEQTTAPAQQATTGAPAFGSDPTSVAPSQQHYGWQASAAAPGSNPAAIPGAQPTAQQPVQQARYGAPQASTPAQPTHPAPAGSYRPAAPVAPAAHNPYAQAPQQASTTQPTVPLGQQGAPYPYGTQQQADHTPTASHTAAQQPTAQQPTAQQPTAQQPQYAMAGGAGNGSGNGAAFGVPAAASAAKKPNRGGLIVAGLAIAALIGGASGAGITAALTTQNGTTVQGEAGPQTVTINNPGDVSAVTAIAAAAMPSVVTITVESDSAAGSGSGVVIDKDGHILTNNHVVSLDGEAKNAVIRVHTSDGRILPATVVGTDPLADLAVLKVENSDLPPVEFANSEDLNVGDLTVAIGAPLGLPGTVTSGVVSALNRGITVGSTTIPSDPEQDQQDEQDPSNPLDQWNFDLDQPNQSSGTVNYVALPVIQTDASINPGNSGGALLNGDGKLIGINVAIASTSSSADGTAGSVGLGFAIPANLAKRVADDIIAGKTVSHGLLGASVGDSSQAADASVAGALVQEVTKGGAAEAAGIKAGDVITKFNGVPVTNRTDLTALVRYLEGDSKVELSYVRDGKTTTVDVTLGSL